MDIKKPNISVIVPIYNVEPYLHRCVDSLLQQSYEDFELILVDDGSPDRCGDICDEYAVIDARIRVIHKPNGGLSDARNAGLEIAQGEFIAFVDSDDWIAPYFLERLVSVQQKTGADICECGVLKTEGSVDAGSFAAGTPQVYDTAEAMKLLIEDEVLHQHVWNKLYRRSVISDVIFPVGKTNEDEFWTYRVIGNAKKVAKIDDTLYFYFQRPGSIMGENYSLKRLDALEAKLQRQKYIDDNFLQLSLQAKLNLFGSCIYAGQMALIHLPAERKMQARNLIDGILRECPVSIKECFRVVGPNRVWFSIAKLSFWGTCKLKNLLKKGF